MRETRSLDGLWRVGESMDGEVAPRHFDHLAPVPGLTHSAKPAFADVDKFESRSFLANMVFNKLRPSTDPVDSAGVAHQPRNYFWYETSFIAPTARAAAFLKVISRTGTRIRHDPAGGARRRRAGGRTVPSGHATILNEYGWLWLNRDGSPTLLTRNTFAGLPYPTRTADDRLRTQAYLLAGLTEYWRAWRRYAGVIHFVYLTGDVPGGFTSDNFSDVRALKLNSYFPDFVGEAFRPLGVYINFWQGQLEVGDTRAYTVMLVNDLPSSVEGTLTLAVQDGAGRMVSHTSLPFEVAAAGPMTMPLTLSMPSIPGDYCLVASAQRGTSADHATVSRRWVNVTPAR